MVYNQAIVKNGNKPEAQLRRRLRPLYQAAFLQGLVFWYTVELLLAEKVGLSAQDVGVILAVMSGVIIVFEVPSGVLADRWSRKGVLLVSTTAMAASSLFGALATQPWHFVAHYLCWGVFYAMYSGTYDSIVYDTLVDEQGHAHNYERWFGRVGRYDSVALVLGSVCGGVLAGVFGVHTPFWATLPVIAIGAICLSRFHEPKLHRMSGETQLYAHIGKTFRAVLSSPVMVYYFVITILFGAVMRTYFEFDQLWLIQLGLPVVLFGIVNGGMLSSFGLRSVIADRLKVSRRLLLTISLGLATLISLGLTVHNRWVAAVSLVVVALAMAFAQLILGVLQQEYIPSHVRAGTNSALSSITHAAFIPMSIAFGWLAIDGRVVSAAWLPVALLLLATVVAASAMRLNVDAVK